MTINPTQASANTPALALLKNSAKTPADTAAIDAPTEQFTSTAGQMALDDDNLITADPQLQDVDAVNQSMEYARNGILGNPAMAMFAQGNSLPQSALLLLQE